jgi:hypothetical protein
MKKTCFLLFVIFAMLITISCKSAPAAAEPVSSPESIAFTDAYQSVLPLILDNAEHYVVKQGETLTRIARIKYGRGNAFFFPLIMAASKDQKTVNIVDPDKIEPGMELVIPNLEANCSDPAISERIKALLLSVAEIYKGRPETRWSSEMIAGLSSTADDL